MRRERTPAWPPCQAWPWRPPETWARQTVLARQPPQVTGRRVTGPRTKPPPSPPPRAPGVMASLAVPPPSSQAWRPWPRVRPSLRVRLSLQPSLRVRPWAWPWELAPPWTWVPASASSPAAPWPCPCSRPRRRKSWSRQSQTQSQIRRRRPRTLPSQTPPPTRHWRPPSRSPRHPSRCPSSPSSRRLFAAACSLGLLQYSVTKCAREKPSAVLAGVFRITHICLCVGLKCPLGATVSTRESRRASGGQATRLSTSQVAAAAGS